MSFDPIQLGIGVAVLGSLVLSVIALVLSRRRAADFSVIEQADITNASFRFTNKSPVRTPYATLAKRRWPDKTIQPIFDECAAMFFNHMNLLYKAYLSNEKSKSKIDGLRRVAKYVYKPWFSVYPEFEMIRILVVDDSHFDLWDLRFKNWLKEKLDFDLDKPFSEVTLDNPSK